MLKACHRFRDTVWRLVVIVTLGVANVPSAQAFSIAPWCIAGGGGAFLCSDRDDRVKLAAASVDGGYLEFVQQAFVAPTVRYVRLADSSAVAVTEHREGGGVDLSMTSSGLVRSRMREAAVGWFTAFCSAKGGRTIRYPINDPELVNVERLACHAKDTVSGQPLSTQPLFGIQVTGANSGGVLERSPVIVMQHLGSGDEVLHRWGYPRLFQVGDNTSLGLVVEMKLPLAKVQAVSDGHPFEQWVKVVDLRPAGP